MKNKIFALGLEAWQIRLDYIEKGLDDCACPVCMTLHCNQWDSLPPSPEAKKHCPLANDPKLCMKMRDLLGKMGDVRWETQHIVNEISRLHVEKGL